MTKSLAELQAEEFVAKNYTSELLFYLNGRKQIVRNPHPNHTLIDFIRSTGLTGTKLGCAEGGCGACTVMVSTWDPESKKEQYDLRLFSLRLFQQKLTDFRHMAVNSCIVPLISVANKHVITVEGIGSSTDPHPVQERIALFHGSQCGFCTPGIVMSMYALLRASDGNPNEEQIAEAFDGNLCRCTGYKPILDAARTFSCGREGGCCRDKQNGTANGTANGSATDSNGSHGCAPSAPLKTPNGLELKEYKPDTELIFPPGLKKIIEKPIRFGSQEEFKREWFRPVTKQQLLDLKLLYPSAKLVGGASEVQIETKFKALNYNVSVFANDIPELKTHRYEPGLGLYIGANISLSDLEIICEKLSHDLGDAGQVYHTISEQLKYFAGRQIRNVATPAGNIATASPIADLNPILVAANAVLTVESVGESRELAMTDFFISYRKTQLKEHEIITEIFIPQTKEKEVICAYKQAKRKDDDISIVTSAICVGLDENNMVTKANLVYGGVAPMTVMSKKAADYLLGRDFTTKETLEGAIDQLSAEFNLPYGVPGGMPTFRKALVLSFFYKFYHTCMKKIFAATEDVAALEEVDRSQIMPEGQRDLENPFEERVVGKSNPHASALKQVTGEALYVDDIPPLHNEVFGMQVMTTKPCAKIISVDVSEALDMEGVIDYCDIRDLPNKKANMWGPLPVGLEKFFADGESEYVGQCIGVITAVDREIAAAAVRAVKIEYDTTGYEPVLTIEDAIERKSFFDISPRVDRGDLPKAFEDAAYTFEGTARMGAQEHFYLEPQGCLVHYEPEDGEMKIYSSSQNPTEVQAFAAQATGVPSSRIVCRVKRLGGGFGGKETRCVQLSSIAAVAAKRCKRPVRMILSRSEDMLTSGHRHPFVMKWKVSLDKDYKFTGLEARFYANAGWSLDLTKGVMDRAVLHADNCYMFPNAMIEAFPCKTNTASNTAFRGFGGPQGMFLAETIIYNVSEKLGLEPDALRELNYYKPNIDSTPYKQAITEDFTVPDMAKQLLKESKYEELRKEVEEFNKSHKWVKRGLAHVPTKFGIAFGALFLNQAGALVHIYHDGSILLTHGGTEMGQGLHTKMIMVCAEELGVNYEDVFISETATNTVANTSASAASASSDLNGMAVKNACDQINERLKPYREKFGPNATMKQMAHAAYFDRVNLSANGFYKTPDIGYVWGTKDPNPKPAFSYFTQGNAVSMVEVNMLTGDWVCLRSDIKMDIGRPINQAIDYGQIEGAFVQGMGLFTLEELLWHRASGTLFTRGPGGYKIPGFRDTPRIFNVSMLHDRPFKHLKTIKRSKGIGEPPLFLGVSVFFALRDALKYSQKEHALPSTEQAARRKQWEHITAPLTTERIREMAGDWIVEKATVVPKDESELPFFVTA